MNLKILFTTILCWIFGLSSGVFSQVVDSGKQTKIPGEEGYQAPLYQTVDEEALERAIDPDLYILGPGDVITVNIWGGLEQLYTLLVSPEGSIQIPTVGNVQVGGMVLSHAKTKIIEAAQKVYKSAEITVNLKKLRRFRIPVTGIVPLPGVYEASAAERVSKLLEKAGGLITNREESVKRPHKKEEIAQQPLSSRRNIILAHQNGDTTRVDFLMFARKNDLRYNPFIQEGDAIYVPPLSEEIGTIDVYGSIRIPGVVEYSPGDVVKDIINICAGFTDDAKLDEVIIARCIGNSAEYRVFELDLSAQGYDWQFPLEKDDRIFVRSISDYHLRHSVEITGEINYPGVYSIVEMQTRLTDVITRAGGFTPDASLADAYIMRTTEEEVYDPEYERLKLIPVADMSEMEYEYFKTKSREQAWVVVDFQALYLSGDSTQDILLRDNDRIDIPLQAKTVSVSGQVANPGLLNWEPGKNYLFYIRRAGGLTYNARKSKIRVIKAATGTWIKPSKNTIINIGDTIFVPEKPERDYWEIYKDIILVATQMATIILLIRSFK